NNPQTNSSTFAALVILPSKLQLFFFSSRRRHTRFDCDWSSDVCSSDLAGTLDAAVKLADEMRSGSFDAVVGLGGGKVIDVAKYEIGRASCRKECRYRLSLFL